MTPEQHLEKLMETDQRACPDCKAAMHEIRLLDKSHGGFHEDMEYALAEDSRGLWGVGNYPIEGRVMAMMCSACGRISLYGAVRRRR
jgi:hypothetical protein